MPDIILNERKIAPIRLLPFLTGWWQLSPDKLVSMLAQEEKWYNINLSSYHLKPNTDYSMMLPKEWDVIISDLSILSHSLKANEDTTHDSYPEWRKQSIHCIPASTFVWMDEFEVAYSRAFARHHFVIENERSGDRELNFDPRIPQELGDCIYEGFESLLPPLRKKDKQFSATDKITKTQKEISKEETNRRNQDIKKRMKELQEQYPDVHSKTRLAYKLLKEGDTSLTKQSGRMKELSPEAIVRITNRPDNAKKS